LILIADWLPDGQLERWMTLFPECEFVDGRSDGVLERHLGQATVLYGLPAVDKVRPPGQLQWIQLTSAGVPRGLCPLASARRWTVTNLAGLYGPTIAEHALAMMLILSRNLHLVLRNQLAHRWDDSVARSMVDLHGKTMAVIGLGNIGQHIARLGRSLGMRVVGCRRNPCATFCVDLVVPPGELRNVLPEADYVVVAAPLTENTEGLFRATEFQAMKRGAYFINVSRGAVADEQALLESLRSGHIAAAGLRRGASSDRSSPVVHAQRSGLASL
jgi:phosphoglycerate dehydrogenase-like enzyme